MCLGLVWQVCGLGWVVFGIIFVELYKDWSGGYCTCNEWTTQASCTAASTVNSYHHTVPCVWSTTDTTFDNTIIAWLSLFQICTLEGWVDVMYYYYLHPDGNYGDALLFVAWIVISNWLLVNLWVGVIYLNYQVNPRCGTVADESCCTGLCGAVQGDRELG